MRPATSTAATGTCSRCSLALLAAAALALAGAACGKKKNDDQDKPAVDNTPQVPQPPRPPPVPRTPLADDPGEHAGVLMWARSFGGKERDEARSVDIDAKGNVAVAGIFSAEVDFGTGTKLTAQGVDGFVGLLDGEGKTTWMVQLTSAADVTVSDVAIDATGNVVVVGWFSDLLDVAGTQIKATGADDAFVVDLDPTGKLRWAKALGGENTDIAWSVDTDAQGGVVVVGEKRGAADFGGGELEAKGSADIFVVALDAAGNHVWSHAYGDLAEDNGRAVVIDSRGDIILAVEMGMALDFGGGKPLPHKGKGDVALVKLDHAGNHVWSTSFGNTFDDIVLGLAVDGADNIIVSGSFEDKLKIGRDKLEAGERADAYVAKFDPEGEPLWARSYGARSEDMASGVAADRYGNIAVTGWFQDKVDFGGGPLTAPNGNMDGFLLELSASGGHRWSKRFGDRDHDRGRAVAMDGSGNIVLAGIYRFTIDIDGTRLESVHDRGAKIAPSDALFARFGP